MTPVPSIQNTPAARAIHLPGEVFLDDMISLLFEFGSAAAALPAAHRRNCTFSDTAFAHKTVKLYIHTSLSFCAVSKKDENSQQVHRKKHSFYLSGFVQKHYIKANKITKFLQIDKKCVLVYYIGNI